MRINNVKIIQILYHKNFLRKFLWYINANKNKNNNPNTSEGSQFHQPPHEPSCNAHQLPKNNVIIIKNK